MRHNAPRSFLVLFFVFLMLMLQPALADGAEELSTLPSALQSIGAEAFYGTGLEKITIPEGTSEIQTEAFAESALTDIMLPSSLTNIADDAFDGTGALAIFTYVEHEDSVEILRYSGTQTTVNVPAYINDKPVTTVKLGCGQGEASGFTDVVKVVLPETIVRLEDYAFGGYLRLTTIEGLEYVQEVGYDAFNGCSELQSAHFSTALRKIDDFSFGNAYSLRYVTLPDDIPYEYGNPYKFRALEELTLLRGKNEATIKLVDGNIFSADGKTLIAVLPLNHQSYYVIPDGTKAIAYGTFAWANFTDAVEIPRSVTSISEDDYYLNGRSVYVYAGSYAEAFFEERQMPSVTVHVIDDDTVTLQDLVDNIIAEVIRDDMTDYDKALALHDWICENGSYDYTYTNTEAIHILTGGSGVCDAYARAYCVLLSAAGIDCRRETCYMDGVGHAINAVKLDGEWCYVDCTNDDEGFGHPDLLFGFNDDIYNAYYSGTLSVSAPSIDHYAPLVDGRLDSALTALKTSIQERLNAGTISFAIVPEGAAQVEDIWGYALAAKLRSMPWTVNGQAVELSCQFEHSAGYICVVNNLVDWFYTETEGGLCLTQYLGSDTDVVIPSELDGIPVVALNNTFYRNETITSAVLPDTITVIGNQAFAGCTALEEINIPSGLKQIGTNAFWGCRSLKTKLVLPASLESIGDGAFVGCTVLMRVVIPAGNVSLGKYIFAECSSLSNVTLGEGVTALTDSMFYQCLKLKRLDLPESLERIESSAFLMSGLERLHLPKNVSEVSWDAFVDATHLTDLTVDPANPYLTVSGGMLFTKDMKKILVSTCSVDTALVIPDGVQEIGAKAFKMNQTLYSVTLPDSVKSIGDEAFMGAASLEHVHMGSGVEQIGQYAFARGYTYSGKPFNETYPAITEGYFSLGYSGQTGMLKSIRFSPNLKVLGSYSLIGQCYLEEIILPASLTSIDGWFVDCATTIYIPESITYIAPQELNDAGGTFTICGIAGSCAETFAAEHGYPFVDVSSSITLNYSEVHLIPKESVTLEVTMINGLEADVDPSGITWTSSNPDCVSVHNGVLKTTGIGTATITAEYQGMKASCKVVSWTYLDPEGFTWWNSTLEDTHILLVGSEVSLRLIYTLKSVDENGNELIDPILPDLDDDTHAVYTVSDPSVLRVDVHGNVTAVGSGTASVIATLPDGASFTYEWTVMK